jgi:hypothetical protein
MFFMVCDYVGLIYAHLYPQGYRNEPFRCIWQLNIDLPWDYHASIVLLNSQFAT